MGGVPLALTPSQQASLMKGFIKKVKPGVTSQQLSKVEQKITSSPPAPSHISSQPSGFAIPSSPPQPGSPSFVGPVKIEPMPVQPGDPSFVGPVKIEPVQPSDPKFVGPIRGSITQVTEYQRTGVVPKWASSQIIVPDVIGKVGATGLYQDISYRKYLGLGTVEQQKQLEIKMRSSRWYMTTQAKYTGGKTWPKIKKEEPALYLMPDVSGALTPTFDIKRWRREQHDIMNQTFGGAVAEFGKVYTSSFLNIFDMGYWFAEDRSKYIFEKEYMDVKKIQKGKGLEVWAGSQIPAYTTAIIPALTGGAFGLAFKTIGIAGAGAGVIGTTTGGILTGFATHGPLVAGGVVAGIIGSDIGITAGSQRTGDVFKDWTSRETLKKVTQYGIMMAGAGAGYKAAIGYKPTVGIAKGKDHTLFFKKHITTVRGKPVLPYGELVVFGKTPAGVVKIVSPFASKTGLHYQTPKGFLKDISGVSGKPVEGVLGPIATKSFGQLSGGFKTTVGRVTYGQLSGGFKTIVGKGYNLSNLRIPESYASVKDMPKLGTPWSEVEKHFTVQPESDIPWHTQQPWYAPKTKPLKLIEDLYPDYGDFGVKLKPSPQLEVLPKRAVVVAEKTKPFDFDYKVGVDYAVAKPKTKTVTKTVKWTDIYARPKTSLKTLTDTFVSTKVKTKLSPFVSVLTSTKTKTLTAPKTQTLTQIFTLPKTQTLTKTLTLPKTETLTQVFTLPKTLALSITKMVTETVTSPPILYDTTKRKKQKRIDEKIWGKKYKYRQFKMPDLSKIGAKIL